MSNFIQTPVEPALPIAIEIPNLAEYSDLQLMDFANSICGMYLQENNRQEVRALLKAECLIRIRRLIVRATDEEMIAEFDNNVPLLFELTRAYVIAVAGTPMKAGFNGPRHLWRNHELRESVISFFIMDEKFHTYLNTDIILDYLFLYNERISIEN